MVIESSPIGGILRELVVINGSWQGTPTQLLTELNAHASIAQQRSKAWPSAPNQVRNQIQRLAPTLRKLGVQVEYIRIPTARLILLGRVAD